LAALAKRMPLVAHRKSGTEMLDVALVEIEVGDTLVIHPHEICPADGVVIEGHGVMDESYLTGEPFQITKTSGSTVISGAINGESALTIRTTQRAADSRYAKIMEVMRESEVKRPQLRRLGDQLGAIYTPVALAVALLAWMISGESIRFLAVLVIATPCPLLLAIPIAIIGSISLCARRAVIVKSPVVLEQIAGCRTAIFDKTGTLTYGEPKLTEQIIAPGFEQKEVLTLVASLERYSKHPLARAILAAAKEEKIQLPEATEVGEQPGRGLRLAQLEQVLRRREHRDRPGEGEPFRAVRLRRREPAGPAGPPGPRGLRQRGRRRVEPAFDAPAGRPVGLSVHAAPLVSVPVLPGAAPMAGDRRGIGLLGQPDAGSGHGSTGEIRRFDGRRATSTLCRSITSSPPSSPCWWSSIRSPTS
jgi:hypothetical protein